MVQKVKYKVQLETDGFLACPSDENILSFYEEKFQSVFVMLHPFIKPVKIDVNRFNPSDWPNKKVLVEGCVAISWNEILKLTGLNDFSEVDVGLRTSIGGIKSQYQNQDAANLLMSLRNKENIIMPEEGIFPAFLENRLFSVLGSMGYSKLKVNDEFGEKRFSLTINDLKERSRIPYAGSVFTVDQELLITTHWDSHCTFICSTQEKINQIILNENFEGFFCDSTTEVYWGVYNQYYD